MGWKLLLDGYAWDDAATVYSESDVSITSHNDEPVVNFSKLVDGNVGHFTFSPDAILAIPPTPNQHPGILNVNVQTDAAGAEMTWRFVYSLAKIRRLLPTIPTTLLVELSLDVNSQTNTGFDGGISLIEVDFGSAFVNLFAANKAYPYLVRGSPSVFTRFIFTLTYKKLADLASGIIKLKISQGSQPYSYDLAYHANLTIFGSSYSMKLATKFVEASPSGSTTPPHNY